MEPFLRFNLFGLLSILSGVLNITLGTIILSKSPRSKLHQHFFLITITGFIWTVGFGLASLVDIKDARLFYNLAYIGGVPFISPSVYLFSLHWRNNLHKLKMGYIGCALSIFFTLWWVIFSEQLFLIRDYSWGRYILYPKTAFAYSYITLLLLFFWGYALMAFGEFYRGWKQEKDPYKKVQFRNILIGFLFAYAGTVDFYAAFKGVYPFGYVTLTILTSVTAYTLIKHQFLDIKLVIRKVTLALVIYVGLITLAAIIGIPLLSKTFGLNNLEDQFIPFLTISLLSGLILSAGPFIYAHIIRRSFWFKKQMSTGLTHELKSPLSNIQSSIDIMIEELKKEENKNKNLHKYSEIIKRNGDRLDLFVKNLLDTIKLNDGNFELNKKRTDFNELTKKTVQVYEPLANQKNIKINLALNDMELVNIDPDKMTQVISNLVSNSIKHSQPKTINIETRSHDKNISFSVSDDGKGMTEEEAQNAFKQNGKKFTSRNGSGLGLNIAKSWVEAHGGRIRINLNDSKPGVLINFILPI